MVVRTVILAVQSRQCCSSRKSCLKKIKCHLILFKSYGHWLYLLGSPRPFRQIERNVSSYLYSVVILSITVIAYPSPGTKGFSWSKEESAGWLPLLSNADLKISSSALQSNLTLMNISRGDFGLYRVTVTNTIGSYEQHIFLSEEKGMFNLPQILQIIYYV